MESLRVALAQTTLHWHNPKANRDHFQNLIEKGCTPKTNPHIDLWVLPEMFTTGFSMHSSQLAEEQEGFTAKWMLAMAKHANATIMGSVITRENQHFFNRLYVAKPDGLLHHYDKRHLFRMADEHQHYSAGQDRIIVEVKGWKLCPLVCYDLRFPVWSRNATLEYDIVVYVANWPSARVSAWDTLLAARAVENHAYCIGVNRIGQDGNGIDYVGHSAVYSPKAECLLKLHDDEIGIIDVQKDPLTAYRKTFPAWKDGDQFTIHGLEH